MANCMVLTNIPENLLSSEVEPQQLDGRGLGNTKINKAKQCVNLSLTWDLVLLGTLSKVIHCWADKG
jgi:hypothetical protein